MRFIGNKESMVADIISLLDEQGLMGKRYTFFDAFCGTGAVSNAVKEHYDLIINDSLKWCTVYTQGRLSIGDCAFKSLGFDPFIYLNTNKDMLKGFFFRNYAPTESQRMYFSPENAGRIDFFRAQIEKWKNSNRINEYEYNYLLACLIESVSSVSNTAGVYGAFLKKWDPRALKPIMFIKIPDDGVRGNSFFSMCSKIESIISDVDCDILYLDPPYTQNQYGTQYHLLETLILNDDPAISKITGSRSTASMRSDWSKEYKANILFEKVVAETKAKYIVFSYNNDGFMSKDYIEAVLKRYGYTDSYVCKTIAYKKYRNWKTKKTDEHFEYLFFVEKKPVDEVVYECPLNYIGSKAKMVTFIRQHTPNNYNAVIDLFGGGFNVGLNISADQHYYNDINYFVTGLVRSFAELDTYQYLLSINRYTKKFGLERGNSESYNNARSYYNSLPIEKREPQLLFSIVLYGFQQQIRFNTDHGFNNPIGNRWFNDRVLEKFISFSRAIKKCSCSFSSYDFKDIDYRIPKDAFVYLDPPYRFTRGAYNDGKRGFEGWTKKYESDLFSFVDNLNHNGIHFMLSYIWGNDNELNTQLQKWLNKNQYTVLDIPTYQGRYAQRKEIVIVNYEC